MVVRLLGRPCCLRATAQGPSAAHIVSAGSESPGAAGSVPAPFSAEGAAVSIQVCLVAEVRFPCSERLPSPCWEVPDYILNWPRRCAGPVSVLVRVHWVRVASHPCGGGSRPP